MPGSVIRGSLSAGPYHTPSVHCGLPQQLWLSLLGVPHFSLGLWVAAQGPRADPGSGNGSSAGFLSGFVEQTDPQLRLPQVGQVTVCVRARVRVCVCVFARLGDRAPVSLGAALPLEVRGRMGAYCAGWTRNVHLSGVWSLFLNPRLLLQRLLVGSRGV